jgi:hypothetical protein
VTEPEVDILGEWVSVKKEDYTLTFQEDGTCFYTGTLIPAGGMVVFFENDQTAGTSEPANYKYLFNRELSNITVYTSLTKTYDVIEVDGKTVIATVDGELAFVRPEDYTPFHAANVEQFFNNGLSGRVELVYGEAYEIQDGISMTVTGWVQGETADMHGKYPLFLRITLTNATETGIYVRNPGGVVNGEIKPGFSEVALTVMPQSYLTSSIMMGGSLPIAQRTNETMLDMDSKLYLEPGLTGEYFIKLEGVYSQEVAQEPAYAVLTFANLELFLNLTAAVTAE